MTKRLKEKSKFKENTKWIILEKEANKDKRGLSETANKVMIVALLSKMIAWVVFPANKIP